MSDGISRAYSESEQRRIAQEWYPFEPGEETMSDERLWNDETAKQLKELRTLLWDIAGLNNGSGCLGILQRSVDAAKSLTDGSPSFLDRMVRDCIRERESQ